MEYRRPAGARICRESPLGGWGRSVRRRTRPDRRVTVRPAPVAIRKATQGAFGLSKSPRRGDHRARAGISLFWKGKGLLCSIGCHRAPGCPQADARSLWSRLQPAPVPRLHSQGRSRRVTGQPGALCQPCPALTDQRKGRALQASSWTRLHRAKEGEASCGQAGPCASDRDPKGQDYLPGPTIAPPCGLARRDRPRGIRRKGGAGR